MRNNTSSAEVRTKEVGAEFGVGANREHNVTRCDARLFLFFTVVFLLEVVIGEFNNLSGEVLENGSNVDRCASTDAVTETALFAKLSDLTDRKLTLLVFVRLRCLLRLFLLLVNFLHL